MSALDPAAFRRLRGAFALFTSDKDGEKLAAVEAVVRILGNAGLTVADLVPAAAEPAERSTTPAWGPRKRPGEVKMLREHQRRAWLLQVSGFAWNDWERRFLASMVGWNSPISAKQSSHLRDLETAAAAWRASREAA
jgi:hypothetical protein